MRVHSQRDKNLTGYPEIVPDELLNEEQAQRNHGQSLSRLNQRGGMSVPEILFNIHKQKIDWSPGGCTDTQAKIDELNDIIARFHNR